MIEGYFEAESENEEIEVSEELEDDRTVTFKEFQVLDSKVDELILLQKEIAAKLMDMNRVTQAQAKKAKSAPKPSPKPKPNPLKFP